MKSKKPTPKKKPVKKGMAIVISVKESKEVICML